MSNVTFRSGSKVVFTVAGTRNIFTGPGQKIVFNISGTGPQGPEGTPAPERKFIRIEWNVVGSFPNNANYTITHNNTGLNPELEWQNAHYILKLYMNAGFLQSGKYNVIFINPGTINGTEPSPFWYFENDTLVVRNLNPYFDKTNSEKMYIIIEDLRDYFT